MQATTNGATSTAIGWEAGGYAESFVGSVAIGQGAGSVERGESSVYIGNGAANNFGTSLNDTVIGYSALPGNGGSTSNTVVGANSGYATTAPLWLTAVGSQAAFVQQGALGTRIRDYGTALGANAGINSVLDVHITNFVAVGFNVPITNSNEIIIGNSYNTKAIFPITSYTGTGSKVLTDNGTYQYAAGGAVIYTNIFATNLAASTDHDIYTIPAGYRGVPTFSVSSTNMAGTTTTSFKVKIGGVYYVLTSAANAGTNTSNIAVTTFIFEPGDIVAISGTLDGLNFLCSLALIPESNPLKSKRLTTFSVGNNTLYTVPANKAAVGGDRALLMSAGATGPACVISQQTGGNLQYLIYLNGTKIADRAVTTGAPIVPASVGALMAGDTFVINSASTDATQFAWMTVYEIDQ
jgi:hypothetical protein